MSISRKGKLAEEKHPMYGKIPWNKGLTKQKALSESNH